jgi:hypothetical protein
MIPITDPSVELEESIPHQYPLKEQTPIHSRQISQASLPQSIQLFQPSQEHFQVQQSTGFETSFPITFLLWVKSAEGLPDVREGPGNPGPPLPQIVVRSPLLDEPLTCRGGERRSGFFRSHN